MRAFLKRNMATTFVGMIACGMFFSLSAIGCQDSSAPDAPKAEMDKGSVVDVGGGNVTVTMKEAHHLNMSASHILFTYAGSKRSRSQRTKDEAMKQAKEVLEELRKDPTRFAEVARKHSDGPTGVEGGSLGIFEAGSMDPAFSFATVGLEFDEISDVVESQFGLHIIKRHPLVHIRQILVMHKDLGEVSKKHNVTRTREEALALIKKCAARIKSGENFDEVAKSTSDCPSAKVGGDRGMLSRGDSFAKLDDACFTLKNGETSDIVDTDFGYYIVYRYR